MWNTLGLKVGKTGDENTELTGIKDGKNIWWKYGIRWDLEWGKTFGENTEYAGIEGG